MVEDDLEIQGDDDDDDDVPPPSPRQSGRQNRGMPPLRYDNVYEAVVDLMCPTTIKEALGEQAYKWATAMDNELESLWRHGVYVGRHTDFQLKTQL